MKSFTAIGLILSQEKPPEQPEIITVHTTAGLMQLERNMQMAGVDSFSMGAAVPYCNCDECGPMNKHLLKQDKSKQVLGKNSVGFMADDHSFVGGYDSGFGKSQSVQISGTTNPSTNGTFKVMGVKTSRLSTKSPNVSNPPRSVDLPLQEAFNLASRKSVRIANSTRINSKKRRLKILDHGPNWKDQGCGIRFKVIRWIGPPPEVWDRVGWTLSRASFATRKEANLVIKDLAKVADVMDA